MEDKTAAEQVDDIIANNSGWKGEIMTAIRVAIKKADPEVVEEIKWRMKSRPEGLAVWSHSGILCFAEIWKDNIKLIFPKGAHLDGLQAHFNARLEGKDIRAIAYYETDSVNNKSLGELIIKAKELNKAK